MSFIAPDASGKWLRTKSYFLRQETPDDKVSLSNITRLPDVNYHIEQRGNFVTYQGEVSILRPVSEKQIGIWKPIIKNGNVETWILEITDYDDNAIVTLQILKKDENGDPIEFYYNASKSGFITGEPQQYPAVSEGIFIKIENLDKCHCNSKH